MAELVRVAQADSTNDGSGAATTIELPPLDNLADDLIILKVTQSLNNSGNVNNIVFTAPAGYTELTVLRDVEIKSAIFYKRSTGGENIPTVTSNTVARWTCTTTVVTDVDWDNGGLSQFVENTSGGDHNSPSLTTDAAGTASAIVCLYSIERRLTNGFRYPQTEPTTIYEGRVTTGANEGVDNCSAAGYDYVQARSSNFNGPFWEANGGGDSLAFNIEVLVKGNVVPLQVATYLQQSAPTNVPQVTMNWCREIVNSGQGLDGNALQTWTFDAGSDVDTGANTITIPGHGMDESMVLNFRGNGGTLPGVPEDSFFYAFPQDANTIQICTVNEDTDSVSDYYYDGTDQRPVQSLSTGSGNALITEARLINATQAPLDVLRPNNGSTSNPGPAPGNYIGDAGYHQNYVSTAQRFDSPFDATGETFSFELQINGNGRIDHVRAVFIDDDGDWMAWTLYQRPFSPNSTGQLIYQMQIDIPEIQSISYSSYGTFDHTKVRYFVIAGRGNNSSVSRFSAINSLTSILQLGGPLTLINGEDADFDQLVELASAYTTSIEKPSDLQIVSKIPIAFGDGVSRISFADSEKSLAFPPLANGVNKFQSYLSAIGVQVNATADSKVLLTNSQIGASAPYTFDVNVDPGAEVDFTGNFYVLGTASLDDTASYDRQVYVGGKGVADNGAEVRNSTFIAGSDIGADNGMIQWTSSTDIESSAFELQQGTLTGHGIEIQAPGSYSFDGLAFNGFGADETVTSAVYNSSGGAVTINVFNGQPMTVRNSPGSTTTVSRLTTLTLTGLQPNTEVRILEAGTTNELAGVENSTTVFTAGISVDSVDIVILNLEYQYQKIDGADTTGNLTLPVQQQVDRNYDNP